MEMSIWVDLGEVRVGLDQCRLRSAEEPRTIRLCPVSNCLFSFETSLKYSKSKCRI